MELGKQIKKLRGEKSLSQESLAEMLYVSRQTISNWENDKSYPDVHSLILLSKVLEVSTDQLMRGDIQIMKEEINMGDVKKFEKLGNVFAVLMVLTVITPVPLVHFLSSVGIGIWVAIFAITFCVATLVEKEKKKFNVQTYREIIAFSEGKQLDEIEKAREEGKRPYQKIFLAICAGAIAFIVSLICMKLLGRM